jgi:hypothetical protein
LIFSKRPLSNETISVRLSLPAPFGRGFLIFETRTVVLGDSVAGVALGVDKADDDSEGLRSFVRGSSGVGVALGDDKREDTGLHLSIADSALSMAVAIADDSARARAVLTDGQQKKSSNKWIQTFFIFIGMEANIGLRMGMLASERKIFMREEGWERVKNEISVAKEYNQRRRWRSTFGEGRCGGSVGHVG